MEQRASSPDRLKAARTLTSIKDEFAGGGKQASPTPKETDGADAVASLRPVSVGGRHSEERIRKRAYLTYQHEHANDPERVGSADGNRGGSGSRLSSREGRTSRGHSRGQSRGSQLGGSIQLPPPSSAGSTSRPISSSSLGDADPLNPLNDPLLKQFRADKTPNATINYETPLAGHTQSLGSSQIIGCQGDFCNFDMSYLENPELAQGDVGNKVSNAKELSEFRKKLLMTGSKSSEFIDSDSNVSRLMKGKHANLAAGGSASSSAADANVKPDSRPTQKIAHKSIIQARQEMSLVKIALEHHRKGEDAPYMRDDVYQDTAASLSMPAHYYQEVPCCLNCFKVYTIVDNARKKALRQIAKKHEEGDNDSVISNNFKNKSRSSTGNWASFASGESPPAFNSKDGNGGAAGANFNANAGANAGALGASDDAPKAKRSRAGRKNSYLEKHITSHQLEQLNQLGGVSDNRRKRGTAIAKASKSQSGGNETDELGFPVVANPSAAEAQRSQAAMAAAVDAINSLTKMDVAEIRNMSSPHPAVEVVMEAVVVLLTGRNIPLKEAFKMMGGGEVFLNMLQEFQVHDVSDQRLAQVEPYVDNPLFRPDKVLPINYTAAKFCAWVHGVVHAARFNRGMIPNRKQGQSSAEGGKNTPLSPLGGKSKQELSKNAYLKPLKRLHAAPTHFNRGENFTAQGVMPARGSGAAAAAVSAGELQNSGDLSFMQKLERVKAGRGSEHPRNVAISRKQGDLTGSAAFTKRTSNKGLSRQSELGEDSSLVTRSMSRLDPGPSPSASLFAATNSDVTMRSTSSTNLKTGEGSESGPARKLTKRESKAMKAMQQKATDRLSAQNVSEGNAGLLGQSKEFRCADGLTKMPYMVMGSFSLTVKRCSFIVVHDFFDTCDATAIMFKPISQRHDGCQILCFNYPGQAHTVWPRLSKAEKERGAKDPIINNDWIADCMHELLRHAEDAGEILLTNPFHVVGIGNGACVAAAFVQKYGRDPLYAAGLRSVVSVNGFLYPDPQLSAILHSSYQVFESAPHSRPDIPVSYWSRFVFSDDYLARINPNLALQIYTAVSNPITNDGRSKITRGALQHRDMRGALAPDFKPNRNANVGAAASSSSSSSGAHISTAGPNADQFLPVQVPVILLQATENTLVNASNVDSFLIGRHSKHLWSHMLNVPSDNLKHHAVDVTAQWVGKMSQGPEDYHKYSTLGKTGLKMVLECLRNPRGAFSVWTRTGHNVAQEYKGALLDLIDVLACPTDEYIGMSSIEASELERSQALLALTNSAKLADEEAEEEKLRMEMKDAEPPAVDVVFEMPRSEGDASTTTSKPKRDDDGSSLLSLIDEASEQSAKIRRQEEAAENAKVVLDPSLVDMISSISYSKPGAENDEEEEQDVEVEVDAQLESKRDQSTPPNVQVSAPAPTSPPPSSSLSQRGGTQPTAQPTEHPTAQPAPVVLNDLYSLEKPDLPPFGSKKERGMEEITVASVASPQLESSISTLSPSEHPTSAATSMEITAAPAPVAPQDTETLLDIDSTDRTGTKVVKALKEGMEKTFIADKTQQKHKEWASDEGVPDVTAALELEAQLREKQQEYLEIEARLKALKAEKEQERLGRIDAAQAERRAEFEQQDQELLQKLQGELDERQRERDYAEKQRRLQAKKVNDALVASGVVPPVATAEGDTETMDPFAESALAEDGDATQSVLPDPVQEMEPVHYDEPDELPLALREGQDVISKLDRMMDDEEQARKRGMMTVEDYERVKREMAERQMARDHMLRSLTKEEQRELFETCATRIQRVGRGRLGRNKAKVAAERKRLAQLKVASAIRIQSQIRRVLAKKRFDRIKEIFLNNMKYAHCTQQVQRVYRGHLGRKYFTRVKRWVSAINIQRAFRGHLGRQAFKREKARLELLQLKHNSVAKIQSVWRMKIAKEEFRSLRIHFLAAIEIQRALRGYLGRKLVKRRRQWESTQPGPERIKLGLEFIEESKAAFERQQEEIDALHRAQERAEARVSHIHAELVDSEKELVVLERELQEIDQIERDLGVLTHERQLLSEGIEDAAGMPRLAAKGHKELVMGVESNKNNDPVIERRRKAEAYALEMTIQIKRSEREKKRQELEIEFASVFQEVEKKKKALERLELSLADMEATRERKEREFRRLQKNLMQLLMEQKQELDDLREKGIQLETATATTAAAAVATSQKAKEHEKRSTAMFSQTEELMKFQFMSMSLSYFSSLNMLKSLRDMNADTTSAAISLSADAAATAASSAAAANLPNMKKLNLGANEFVEASIQKKKAELQESKEAEKEYHSAVSNPMPDNVRSWTVNDVARWLDSLSLNQYASAFVEASVDGPFLLELREEDMVQVLGIKHKLHVRKILLSREKLLPLNQQEVRMKAAVETEDRADAQRAEMGVPSLDTVFSQARNGRVKRVEESLNLGFPIDGEDEKGNTLLLVASQNSNRRLVEMLLIRGANINHQNAQGNSALHFALTFDTEGTLGEYLIEHGADDTLENIDGLTPYDGVAA